MPQVRVADLLANALVDPEVHLDAARVEHYAQRLGALPPVVVFASANKGKKKGSGSIPCGDQPRGRWLGEGVLMVTLHVLKVFIGEGGPGGNPLGVFHDGPEVPEEERQHVAADLGFSETVFVEDRAHGDLRIFTPGAEIPFGGHPLVGTAWLLAQEGTAPQVLHPPAGEVPVRLEGELTFISARAEWAPPFEQIELGSPAEVEALEGPPEGHDLVGVWAWEYEEAGHVRVRVFAPRYGVEEDEASGANAVRLTTRLGRRITIRQGKGSLILAEPRPDGSVEIGGRTELVEVREYEGGSS